MLDDNLRKHCFDVYQKPRLAWKKKYNDTMVMIPVLSNKERGCARIAIDKYTKTKPKKKTTTTTTNKQTKKTPDKMAQDIKIVAMKLKNENVDKNKKERKDTYDGEGRLV